jgi:hypothetical protein
MKIQYLIIFLIVGIFVSEGQAMSPKKGGATGGAAAAFAPDVKRCDLKPREQTMITLQDKSGKPHFLCVGTAVCEGKKKDVACEVGERDACPDAKKCSSVGITKQVVWENNGFCDIYFSDSKARKYSSMDSSKNCLIKYSTIKYEIPTFVSGGDITRDFTHNYSFSGKLKMKINEAQTQDVDFKFDLNYIPTNRRKIHLLDLNLNNAQYETLRVEDSSDEPYFRFIPSSDTKKIPEITFKLSTATNGWKKQGVGLEEIKLREGYFNSRESRDLPSSY